MRRRATPDVELRRPTVGVRGSLDVHIHFLTGELSEPATMFDVLTPDSGSLCPVAIGIAGPGFQESSP